MTIHKKTRQRSRQWRKPRNESRKPNKRKTWTWCRFPRNNRVAVYIFFHPLFTHPSVRNFFPFPRLWGYYSSTKMRNKRFLGSSAGRRVRIWIWLELAFLCFVFFFSFLRLWLNTYPDSGYKEVAIFARFLGEKWILTTRALSREQPLGGMYVVWFISCFFEDVFILWNYRFGSWNIYNDFINDCISYISNKLDAATEALLLRWSEEMRET